MIKSTTKKLLAVLLSALVLLTPLAVTADANTATVTINGEAVAFRDQGPVIIEDRTLVPARDVFEKLGWAVNWDRATATVLLTRGHTSITIVIGEPTFGVLVYDPDSPHPGHGTIGMLDVPAKIIGGRTLLPIRPVLESVGYEVDWDRTTRTVTIITPPQQIIFEIEEYDGVTAAALELLYSDDFNRYYLSSMRSAVVMLTFEDGTQMSVREALDAGKVTVFDLIYNGLDVIVMDNIETEDRPERPNGPLLED